MFGRDSLRSVDADPFGEHGPQARARELPCREGVSEPFEEPPQEGLVREGGRDRDEKEGDEGRVQGAEEMEVGPRVGGGASERASCLDPCLGGGPGGKRLGCRAAPVIRVVVQVRVRRMVQSRSRWRSRRWDRSFGLRSVTGRRGSEYREGRRPARFRQGAIGRQGLQSG